MSATSQDSSIAASLRDDILRGAYRCGERLPSERDLAQRFGVHRSAVREALKRLEQLGIATIQPGGARVAPLEDASLDVVEHLIALESPPEPEILDQALEAMSGLRSMAARLGSERATPEQRERMLRLLSEMRKPDLSMERLATLTSELGDCLIDASGNMVIRLMRRGLSAHRKHIARTQPLLTAAPEAEEIDPLLDRLTQAIESANGAVASESVYELSCLFRRKVRERSAEQNWGGLR